MNCDAANDRLLDLLYEELEGPEAEETRAHVQECASCKASYEKLHSTQRLLSALPEEEPDRSLDAKILAAARQKVGAEPERAEERRRDEGDEPGGLWGAILRWLSGFAASPQFVMATMMMLVVAIGLWYLPAARRAPEASGGTVVHPDHQGEAAPSATLEPAEPLDLDIDERTGRLRNRGDGEPPGGAATGVVQQAEADPLDGAEEGRVRGRAPNRAERAGDVVAGDLDSLADDEAPAFVMDLAEGESLGGGPRGSGSPEARTRRSAPPSDTAYLRGGEQADRYDREAEESRAEMQAGAPTRAPSAPAQAAPPPSTESAGADYGGSAGAPAPSRDETMPIALHGQAENRFQAGAYRECVATYQSLLQRYPSYSRRAQARLGMAECQRRLGQLDAALANLRWVEQNHTRLAPRARRERIRVEQMQRAQTRPSSADEAAAEPAAAH